MKPLLCNLKMNFNLEEMMEYKHKLDEVPHEFLSICPSYPFLTLMHSKKYHVIAQNVSSFEENNHTGEVSARSLKSIDVFGVLIGHSETNTSFDQKIAKTQEVLKNKMHAYVIISDRESDFNYQYTSLKLLNQIHAILGKVSKKYYSDITFIYEPSWLVGTKNSLNLEDVSSIFKYMREQVTKEYGYIFPFFYGGGITKNTIKDFYDHPNIDGLLLGNYSLKIDQILEFIENENSRQSLTQVDKTLQYKL